HARGVSPTCRPSTWTVAKGTALTLRQPGLTAAGTASGRPSPAGSAAATGTGPSAWAPTAAGFAAATLAAAPVGLLARSRLAATAADRTAPGTAVGRHCAGAPSP